MSRRSDLRTLLAAYGATAGTLRGQTVMIVAPDAAGLHRLREAIRSRGGNMALLVTPRPRLVHPANVTVICDDL